MPYKALVKPNLNQTGSVGGCLAYARQMFGAPGGVLYAWRAWTMARYKHPDRNLPTDVPVLMWYSYTFEGMNEGHVTVNVPGKGIYSSPYKKGTSHAVLGSIAEVERIYHVTYVGWSEDINGVRVAEPVETPKPAPAKPATYTVKRGDVLSSIAAKHGTTWQYLATINKLANPNLIKPGQVLKLS